MAESDAWPAGAPADRNRKHGTLGLVCSERVPENAERRPHHVACPCGLGACLTATLRTGKRQTRAWG